MLLLFLTPEDSKKYLYFDLIPSRSFVHLFLFWGFVHVWLVALKKQLYSEWMRARALFIVVPVALLLAFFSEFGMYAFGISATIGMWNLVFDLIGSVAGLISFRLVYAQSY